MVTSKAKMSKKDAENDWITMKNSERRAGKDEAKNEIARELKREGIDPAIIVRSTGLSLEEIAKL